MDSLISKSLSNDEISNFFNGNINIITYKDLPKYESIEQLLYPYGMAVILYLTKKNYGHWTCVFENCNGNYEFFDSYSYKPDDEFKFIKDDFKKESNQDYAYLCDLLYNSGREIEYNEIQLQEKKPKIATCGRWCVLRLLFKDMPLNIFQALFNIENADEMATKFTYFI